MKYTYLSKHEFHSKCPCGYQLTEYAKTFVPPKFYMDFVKAEISQTDENTYTAIYDVLSPDTEKVGQLEVECTIFPNRDYRYKLIHKSGNFQNPNNHTLS